MEKIIGYSICGYDNDSYMLRDKENNFLTTLKRCSICGELLKKKDIPTDKFNLKKQLDFSATYDGFTICSQRFVDFYDFRNYSGLDFDPIKSISGYYIISVGNSNILEFDAIKRKTRFMDKKECCKRYESIIGATPVYLKSPDRLKDGVFYRTDLEFGSGDEKSPLLLVALKTGKEIKQENFRGIDFGEILKEIL
jgi:hypothetical protein